eukprot:6187786-Pleurochrysis_carterae.AAC.1
MAPNGSCTCSTPSFDLVLPRTPRSGSYVCPLFSSSAHTTRTSFTWCPTPSPTPPLLSSNPFLVNVCPM